MSTPALRENIDWFELNQPRLRKRYRGRADVLLVHRMRVVGAFRTLLAALRCANRRGLDGFLIRRAGHPRHIVHVIGFQTPSVPGEWTPSPRPP